MNRIFLGIISVAFLASCAEKSVVDITPCMCYDEMKKFGNSAPNYEQCSDSLQMEYFKMEYARCQYSDITGKDYEGTEHVSSASDKLEIGAPEDGTYELDRSKSSVLWYGENFTGKSHNGRISLSAGEVEIVNGMISSADILIDMNSLKVDSPSNQEKNLKLRNHLKGPEFFDVENYPEAQFVLTSFEEGKHEQHQAKGMFTVKGSSHNETADLMVARKGSKLALVGKLTFDRSKYGVNYNSPSIFSDLGDAAIKDEVELSITLIGAKK